MDKNKDGFICIHEIESCTHHVEEFTRLIGKEMDWKTILKTLDTNNDEKLDYHEFLQAATNKTKLLNEGNLRKAFAILDDDKDGRVSAEELKRTFAAGSYKLQQDPQEED
jgi:Ca2+-binding EF-hand superfamily protein